MHIHFIRPLITQIIYLILIIFRHKLKHFHFILSLIIQIIYLILIIQIHIIILIHLFLLLLKQIIYLISIIQMLIQNILLSFLSFIKSNFNHFYISLLLYTHINNHFLFHLIFCQFIINSSFIIKNLINLIK